MKSPFSKLSDDCSGERNEWSARTVQMILGIEFMPGTGEEALKTLNGAICYQ